MYDKHDTKCTQNIAILLDSQGSNIQACMYYMQTTTASTAQRVVSVHI